MASQGRNRLTITLRKDLLPLVDSLVDGTTIRNRSHAIEYVLSQHLGPKFHHALILAGGEGVKLRPFTYELPKSMIPVKGRPILEYVVDLLREYGFRKITLLTGHLGDKIQQHFGDGSKFGVQIDYIEEKGTVGTAGALRAARGHFKDTFLLIYGDVLADLNLRDFVDFHSSHNGIVTTAVTTVADPSGFGVVRLHGPQIVDYVEKPDEGTQRSHIVSAGIHVMEPEIFAELPNRSPASLERDVFPRLARKNKLVGYPFEGQWFDVSTPEVYERVIKEWQQE